MKNLEESLSNNLDSILENGHLYEKQMQRLKVENSNRTCLWHRRGDKKHQNNFGLMGECKDCMAAMKNKRCVIDVCNFDLDTYWTVRNFWLKVDVRSPNECWPWLGATKKANTETVAYMPSPFHSGKTQSAARVAFWVSRGYTGKMRIFHRPECDILCCNPLHLYVKELASIPQPTELESFNLSYGNIFEQAKADLQKKSDYFQ